MKKSVFLILFTLMGVNTYAQLEASNWFFGENAGLKFNLGNNTVTQSLDGQLNTREGCSSISDSSGNLLFYTDGLTVWNKNHIVMPNGFGLSGDSSSTQSAIIVPKPGDENIYYIFTVDNELNGFDAGLNYSEVDIRLDGGNGDITVKNTNLLAKCSEKITAVLKDCITKSIWVVTFASENGFIDVFNTFHAFEVSNIGVSNTSVKSTFPIGIDEARGYLKLSPDGTKLANANINDGLFLYDFDDATGFVSNQKLISATDANNASYGIEFSPNSQLLYVHWYNNFFDGQNPNNNNNPANYFSSLIQYNLSAADIQGSGVLLDNRQLYRGGMQIGPDGKIYRALSATYGQGLPFLGVIQNPNILGVGCNYVHNAINLSPFNSSQGLPPFISSFFNEQIDIIKNGESTINLALCDGDRFTLVSQDITNATYTWTRDKLPLPNTSFDLEITQSGHYEVYIDPNNGSCAIEGQAFVTFNPNPIAYNHTILQCDEDGMLDGLTLFNVTEANADLTGNVAGLSTRFYTDSARTIEITSNAFSNTVNPQIIYVEVINDQTRCVSYSELTLSVSVTDSKDAQLIACDDDGIEDGFHVFDLRTADSEITNGLPTGLNISYFETYDNALLEVNKLGASFVNTIPYSQTIYARVENANNCYGISDVLLTVNKLPNIELTGLEYYCINIAPKTIPINAGIINDSPTNYTYSWSSGENTYQIEINEVKTYTVTVTNSSGCFKTKTINIEPSNVATFESIEVKDVTQNNTITAFVSGEGIYEYRLLDENNAVYLPFQESNIFENVKPGFYTVSVRDIKNDCGVVNDKVSVVGFPKYFTPNNDGINDFWQVYGVSSTFQPKTIVYIFDRYGKLLKQISPLEVGWDGLFNGEILPNDDYWFSIKLEDGRIFKNHFTLKR